MAAWAMPLQTCCTVFVIALLWRARLQGSTWGTLHGYLLTSAFVLVAWRTIDLIRGQVHLRAYGQARAFWPQLAAVALRVAVWLLMAAAVDVSMPHEYFRRHGESPTKGWIAAGVLVLTAVLPRRRRWEPSDALFGVLLVAIGFDLSRALSDRAQVALDVTSPLEGTTYVLNGSGGWLMNEHAQTCWSDATDLYPLTSGGAIRDGDGLAAYPCFGAPVTAPVSGRIASVVNDRPDMPLGELDLEVPTGNSLSIQTSDGRYLFLAHLEQSSVLVEEGAQVTAGQEIARCGNSGMAGVPHLLLRAQNSLMPLEECQGGHAYPLRFVDVVRHRGDEVRESPFVARRNDIISPLSFTMPVE